MRRARGVALAALAALAAAALPAQGGRHELGLRLRAFERHLAEVPDPARRDAAFVELERAVQAFFRLDMASVAAAVDAADVALAGAEASADERFARSLQLQLGRRLVDAGSAQLQIEVSQLYEADARQQLTFAWRVHDDAPWQRRPIAAVPFEIERELRDLPVGDHTFAWRIERDQQPVLARSMAFAAVADLDARLERVFAAAATARKINPKSIESATLPALANLLRTTLRRSAYETELAGRALLLEAERLVGWLDDSREQHRYHGERPGSFRLRVPTGRRTVAARLFAPAVDQGRRPIVVALHGAGGSENLFFDGYGDGLCVELARRRGWFVVSPRNGMGFVDTASLVDALAERYPIDRERVFVVGHSMGAVQTMQNVSRRPDRFRAAAPIAGGGSVRASQAFARLPFFVCAGERDFGLGGARRLHRAIDAAGATASFRVYPAVEHLAIVQVALPDVFAFFDEHAK